MKNTGIFIGFKDKKGRKIYTGDIIKYRGSLFDVIFCNGSTRLIERESMFNLKVGDFFLLDFLGRNCRCFDKEIKEFEKQRKRK